MGDWGSDPTLYARFFEGAKLVTVRQKVRNTSLDDRGTTRRFADENEMNEYYESLRGTDFPNFVLKKESDHVYSVEIIRDLDITDLEKKWKENRLKEDWEGWKKDYNTMNVDYLASARVLDQALVTDARIIREENIKSYVTESENWIARDIDRRCTEHEKKLAKEKQKLFVFINTIPETTDYKVIDSLKPIGKELAVKIDTEIGNGWIRPEKFKQMKEPNGEEMMKERAHENWVAGILDPLWELLQALSFESQKTTYYDMEGVWKLVGEKLPGGTEFRDQCKTRVKDKMRSRREGQSLKITAFISKMKEWHEWRDLKNEWKNIGLDGHPEIFCDFVGENFIKVLDIEVHYMNEAIDYFVNNQYKQRIIRAAELAAATCNASIRTNLETIFTAVDEITEASKISSIWTLNAVQAIMAATSQKDDLVKLENLMDNGLPLKNKRFFFPGQPNSVPEEQAFGNWLASFLAARVRTLSALEALDRFRIHQDTNLPNLDQRSYQEISKVWSTGYALLNGRDDLRSEWTQSIKDVTVTKKRVQQSMIQTLFNAIAPQSTKQVWRTLNVPHLIQLKEDCIDCLDTSYFYAADFIQSIANPITIDVFQRESDGSPSKVDITIAAEVHKIDDALREYFDDWVRKPLIDQTEKYNEAIKEYHDIIDKGMEKMGYTHLGQIRDHLELGKYTIDIPNFEPTTQAIKKLTDTLEEKKQIFEVRDLSGQFIMKDGYGLYQFPGYRTDISDMNNFKNWMYATITERIKLIIKTGPQLTITDPEKPPETPTITNYKGDTKVPLTKKPLSEINEQIQKNKINQ